MPTPRVVVQVDLSRVRENTLAIAKRVGVDVLAVIKTDAYGLGAHRVAQTIADIVSGFCVFSLDEARNAGLWDVAHKPILALGAAATSDARAEDFSQAHVRPAVWTVDQAHRLRAAAPILCVDTGMQRFSCPPENLEAILRAAPFDEAFTHATRVEHARSLSSMPALKNLRLHAAASALLDEPDARLNAVRPGIALYRRAIRVSTRLVEVHESGRPAGYGGFIAPQFGVILCGYAAGLRPGPCLVGGQTRKILEVGMQSAFVEIGGADRAGDEVVLLGDSLPEAEVARAWGVSEHHAMVILANAGQRCYRDA